MSSHKKENRKEIWDKPRPRNLPKPNKLTPEEKSAAKLKAKKAGRPYPNLIENMAASRKKKES